MMSCPRAHTPTHSSTRTHPRAHTPVRTHAVRTHARAHTPARTRTQVNPAKWYLIVPCAVRAGVEGTFWVRVTSSQPFSFKPLREYTPSAAEQDAMRRCAVAAATRAAATQCHMLPTRHTVQPHRLPSRKRMRKCAVAEDRPAVGSNRPFTNRRLTQTAARARRYVVPLNCIQCQRPFGADEPFYPYPDGKVHAQYSLTAAAAGSTARPYHGCRSLLQATLASALPQVQRRVQLAGGAALPALRKADRQRLDVQVRARGTCSFAIAR